MRWLTATMQLFGLCNVGLAALGLWFLIHIVPRVIGDPKPDPSPYFIQAFLVMSGINLLLISVLVFTGIQLLRKRPRAVRYYSWFVLVSLAYSFSIGGLWLVGDGIGSSIAGATGIGNMGIAPFEVLVPKLPFAYPIASVVILNLIQRALARRSGIQLDQPQQPAT